MHLSVVACNRSQQKYIPSPKHYLPPHISHRVSMVTPVRRQQRYNPWHICVGSSYELSPIYTCYLARAPAQDDNILCCKLNFSMFNFRIQNFFLYTWMETNFILQLYDTQMSLYIVA